MSYRRPQHNGKIIRYGDKHRNLSFAKASQENTIDDVYMQLKRDVKRSSIITRMQQKKNASFAGNRTADMKRAPNEQLSKAEGLRELKRIYEREQLTIGDMLLQQQSKEAKKQERSQPAKIKEGLLGEFKYYERMEKSQLIEKLIALEYLTQKLYKRNKYLEQQVEADKKVHDERGTPTSFHHTFY